MLLLEWPRTKPRRERSTRPRTARGCRHGATCRESAFAGSWSVGRSRARARPVGPRTRRMGRSASSPKGTPSALDELDATCCARVRRGANVEKVDAVRTAATGSSRLRYHRSARAVTAAIERCAIVPTWRCPTSRRPTWLSGVPLFAGISDDSMARLAAVAGEQDFAAGQFIVRQGQVGTGLYVIVDGAVDVIHGADDVDRHARRRASSSVSCRLSTSSHATRASRRQSRRPCSPSRRGISSRCSRRTRRFHST